MNACVLFAGALTDANLSVVLGREGIFFLFWRTSTRLFIIFWPFGASRRLLYHIAFQRFLAKKKKNLLCTLCNFENTKIRYYVVDVL